MGPVSGVEIRGVNDMCMHYPAGGHTQEPKQVQKEEVKMILKGGQAKLSYESQAYHGNLHIECVHSHGQGY